MSFNVLPFERAGGIPQQAPAARPATAPGSTTFAKVYDLAAARAARRERIPHEVLDEVDAAARLYEQLHAEGQHMRFDAHRLEGRAKVVVDLCDLEGNVLRPISLTDAVDMPPTPDSAA